jgi:hypothetical protein
VPDEHGPGNVEFVEDSDVVPRSRVDVIPSSWLARASEATARDADDAEPISELVCEFIEHVGVVAGAREQHQGIAGAAPVQHLQMDIGVDRDKNRFVRRGIEAADVVGRRDVYRRTR